MKHLNGTIWIVITFSFLNGCSNSGSGGILKDEKQEAVENYFKERISSESNGLLEFKDIEKVNGVEKGSNQYQYEYRLSVKAVNDCSKGPFGQLQTYFENKWATFKVVQGYKKTSSNGWEVKEYFPFHVGDEIQLEGELIMEKADNGWRVGGKPKMKAEKLLNSNSGSENTNNSPKKCDTKHSFTGQLIGAEVGPYNAMYIMVQTGKEEKVLTISPELTISGRKILVKPPQEWPNGSDLKNFGAGFDESLYNKYYQFCCNSFEGVGDDGLMKTSYKCENVFEINQ